MTSPAAYPELMKLPTAAAFLDMSPSAFTRLVKEGQAPAARRRGAMVRWHIGDLRAFANNFDENTSPARQFAPINL